MEGIIWSIKRSKGPTNPNPINPRRYSKEELNPDPAACSHDRGAHYFSTMRQRRRIRPISTLADGMEVQQLSFDSLREISGCLLEMNQEEGNVILECSHHAQGNHGKSCASLKRWLKNGRDLLPATLQHLRDGQEENYERELNELRRITKEIHTKFQAMWIQQNKTVNWSKQQKKKLGKKLKLLKAGMMLSRVASAFAVIISSVVAAAVASPPVAAVVGAAAAIPLGKWVNSPLKKREGTLKRRMEAAGAMHAGSYMAMKDLDSIKAMIDGLEVQINSLSLNREPEVGEEMLEGLMTSMEELGEHADGSCRDTIVLQRIIKGCT